MRPNIQLNWIKDSIEQNSSLEKKCKITDGSGLQFIDFDFVAGGQEIKLSILLKF